MYSDYLSKHISRKYIPINETMEVKREVYEGEFG